MYEDSPEYEYEYAYPYECHIGPTGASGALWALWALTRASLTGGVLIVSYISLYDLRSRDTRSPKIPSPAYST